MAMRWLHFRVDEQLYERARQVAAADRRSLSNWVALIIERAVEDKPCGATANDGDQHGTAA